MADYHYGENKFDSCTFVLCWYGPVHSFKFFYDLTESINMFVLFAIYIRANRGRVTENNFIRLRFIHG